MPMQLKTGGTLEIVNDIGDWGKPSISWITESPPSNTSQTKISTQLLERREIQLPLSVSPLSG